MLETFSTYLCIYVLYTYMYIFICTYLGVRVIAWGLSLERPTMIKYKIENIRDLFGHKADLPRQRNAPIALYNQLV
jgi:hypothetical protein